MCFKAYSPLKILAFCHSDRQSLLVNAVLIHKPALSTFDARERRAGKMGKGERKDGRDVLPVSFDIYFLCIASFYENKLHFLTATFKFKRLVSVVCKDYRNTHMGLLYLSYLPHFITVYLSHTRASQPQAEKTLQDIKSMVSFF